MLKTDVLSPGEQLRELDEGETVACSQLLKVSSVQCLQGGHNGLALITADNHLPTTSVDVETFLPLHNAADTVQTEPD